MGTTKVSLTIPFTFAPEGKYQVSMDGKIANIEITYVPNDDALNSTMGIEAIGKRQLMPDDPEGLVNISKITFEFSFELLEADPIDEGPDKLDPVRHHCVIYLNRLREVIRYYTNQYSLRSISPFHLNIYEVVGRGRRLTMVAPPSENLFPTPVKEFTEVQSQITETLFKETAISLSDKLYHDALNFFYFFSFAEAIITANTALEVFVWRCLFKRYKSRVKSEGEAKIRLKNIFEGSFHKVMKNEYFNNSEDRFQHPIWQKLENVRDTRSVVHPHTKIPSLAETKQVLIDISDIMKWVSEQG